MPLRLLPERPPRGEGPRRYRLRRRSRSCCTSALSRLESSSGRRASLTRRYRYDSHDPPPTLRSDVLSNVYTAGSVDVSELQRRPDVLSYTTEPLDHDVDVVWPVRLTLYASSSAVYTDFSALLCDVFPDERAIQIQSGTLRARIAIRMAWLSCSSLVASIAWKSTCELQPTVRRRHCMRLDLSSADFPRSIATPTGAASPGRRSQPSRSSITTLSIRRSSRSLPSASREAESCPPNLGSCPSVSRDS